MDHEKSDWDPRAQNVLDDQMKAYDEMRRKCPVAHSDFHQWSLFRHEDVMEVLLDPDIFSNEVSTHVSVPNSMDPPEHTYYRQLIEPFFDEESMAAFEPHCRTIAARLVAAVPRNEPIEFIADFAMQFALKVQCAFLGWPEQMQETLGRWMQKNHAATLARDRDEMAAVAEEFAGFVRQLLENRRAGVQSDSQDVVSRLMRCEVKGRPLLESEIISILRNWTGGEVGTITASVGILGHYLAENPNLQQELRRDPSKLPYAIDEILRLHGPLVTNRRKTRCPVTLGGRQIEAGERLTIFWVSANRDEEAFEAPEEFRWDRDPSKNLLYGAGIHVCPGAPLARMELRIIMEELLANSSGLTLEPGRRAPKAIYPASGYAQAHIIIAGDRAQHEI